MRELRRDPIIGRWVIISSERGKRPSDFIKFSTNGNNGNNEDISSCPFCWGNEKFTPSEIISFRSMNTQKDTPGWWVRVIPNKFPALKVEGQVVRTADGIYDKMSGIGAHEVIIETNHHNKDLYEIEDKLAEDIFRAYRERMVDLKRDIRFEYILIFKNKGLNAGATLSHPHSQLIALPMVPVRIKQEISGAKLYFEYKERCVFCDIISYELKSLDRIVAENEDFVAICPYASRFSFEVWVLPKRHDSMFEDINDIEIKTLTQIMKLVNKKLNLALDNPHYNYLLHTSPLKTPHLEHYHWHIEIMPKLFGVGGFEWGTGFYINPTPPEEAAKFLREI